jgi:uncharacterized membrane protein YfcA
MDLFIVTLASLFAGLVDSIVGGGGLILVPALFATFPSAPPATLLGSNKSASIWGTSFATYQFSRQVELRWAALIPAALAGVMGSLSGAWAVTQLDPGFLRQTLPFLLLALLAYTLVKKDMGQTHAPLFSAQQESYVAILMGLLIGFYDGFFGPGTGSFFVFAYVRLLGYDFLNASASAKVMNLATNFSALVLFTGARPCVVAFGIAHGHCQCDWEFDWHAPGIETRRRFCALCVLGRGGCIDHQNWLRRLHEISSSQCVNRHTGRQCAHQFIANCACCQRHLVNRNAFALPSFCFGCLEASPTESPHCPSQPVARL